MKTQLDSLTAFFRANVPERAQQGFSSEIEEMRTVPAERDLGQGQYRMNVIRYDAQLAWERFPYRLCAPQLLMVLLQVWVDEYGSDLMDELGITAADPSWDVAVEDGETATVVLTMPLVEELVIRQDDKGAIPWRGQRWSLAEPEVLTAFSAAIYGTDAAAAPVDDA